MKNKDKQQIVADILRDCIIKIEKSGCGSDPFEHINLRQVLSVMDNAVFYMYSEIKGIEDLNSKWRLVRDKSVMRDIKLDCLLNKE